jgi:hypothetical protein
LMLVARLGGKLIYVPIGGSPNGEDPVPEEEIESTDPCNHPGGGDSVVKTDGASNSHGGVNPGGGVGGGGNGEIGVTKCP